MDCFLGIQLKKLSTLFNKEFEIILQYRIGRAIAQCSDKFVFQLVLEACNNPAFREQIHKKIVHYTSFIKNYLSGIQFIEQNLETFLKKIEKSIMSYIDKYSKSARGEILKGNLINFYYSEYGNNWLPSNILSNEIIITMVNDDMNVTVNEIGATKYEDILMHGIVGVDTIKEYGKDGFIALLIIFLHKDLIESEIESLQTKCLKIQANKFNELFNPQYNYFIEFIRRCLKVNNSVQKISPKIQLKRWIALLENMKTLPNHYIDLYKKHINISIQKVLFKETITDNMHTIYHIDYDAIIDKLNYNFFGLNKYIKDIYKIKTFDGWIEYLQKLLDLPSKSILIIFLNVDYSFANVFLSALDFSSIKDTFQLKISSQKWYRYINGTYYNECEEFYNINNVRLSSKTWIYDKNLNIIGYKIGRRNITGNTEVSIIDVDGKIISTSTKDKEEIQILKGIDLNSLFDDVD